MLRSKSFLSGIAGATSLAMLAACGGGGSGTATEASTSALTDLVSEVPVAGEFLADCTVTGFAMIDEFVGGLPLPDAPVDLPDVESVLANADANDIPVIGGLVPSDELLGDGLVPVSVDDVLAMIPAGGLPAGLPVSATIPVSCSDLASTDLPVPTDALGLIPVFDANGDVVAVILATVSELQNAAPTDLGLPFGTDTLPEPLGSTVATLLGVLGL